MTMVVGYIATGPTNDGPSIASPASGHGTTYRDTLAGIDLVFQGMVPYLRQEKRSVPVMGKRSSSLVTAAPKGVVPLPIVVGLVLMTVPGPRGAAREA